MTTPKSKSQLNLPPALLPKREQDDRLLPKQEQGEARALVAAAEAQAVAATLFADALALARPRISDKEVAYLLGVSESLVRKWRSPDRREQPSWTQLLRMPLSFHVALHRAMNERFGFGRRALVRLLAAVGDVAVAGE